MPDTDQVVATRVALLELRDERQLLREGFSLLDEKRMLLAGETLRQLRHYVATDQTLQAGWREAREAFGRAIEVHGFDGLTLHPPHPLDEALLHVDRQVLLGVPLVDAELVLDDGDPLSAPGLATPELRACVSQIRNCVRVLVAQAARAANLRRLVAEYRRTERRARALENVLLPDIERLVVAVEDQLDALDQEDALRVRNAARGPGRP